MQYSLVGNEEGSWITVFVAGQAPLSAHSSHPNFDDIVAGVAENDESVFDLFDVGATVSARFERLTERITYSNGALYFDGDEVDNALTAQAVRFLKDGVPDWEPLVLFFENVQQNPNEHSREQLYSWLYNRDFTITEDGNLVGYKSVQSNGDGSFNSISSGKAIVNGELQTGRINQSLGSEVEMPRSEVAFDPATGCSSGLHVGTWDYADSFSGDTVLEVHVNPRDVVSVPTDCEAQKMRVCRYIVVDTVTKQYSQSVVSAPYWDEPEDDEADDWGDGEGDYDPDYTGSFPSVLQQVSQDGVKVGDKFRNNDSRRSNVIFTVTGFDGDSAVGTSQPAGVKRTIQTSRLNSYRYSKV